MFAVKGWNISAPLKTQTEAPNQKEAPEGKKSRKRKRKQQEQVDESNVGQLWEKVFEKKSGGDQSKQDSGVAGADNVESEKKSRKRKRKTDKESEVTNNDVNSKVDGANVPDDIPGRNALDLPRETIEPPEGVSKREKKKRKKDHDHKPQSQLSTNATIIADKSTAMVSLLPEPKGLTPMQKSMRQKLAGARFRHLNETLYTKPSIDSLSLFKENPEMFEDYHRGFAQQTESWPENPVDGYVQAILARGEVRVKDPWKDKKRKEKKKGRPGTQEDMSEPPNASSTSIKPLPRNMKGHSTIADLGCGTASLSYRLQSQLKHLNLTLHSFDLSKPSGPSANLVTVADISALPLPDASVDVAIFCLALMGTNWLDFIDEAYRILRWKGELWVAEIKSRFGRVAKSRPGKAPINSIGLLRKPDKKQNKANNNNKKKSDKPEDEGIQGSDDEAELAEHVDGVEGREGTDVSAFVDVLRKHGFVLDAPPEAPNQAVDLGNKMFVKMQFVKAATPSKGKNAKKEHSAGQGFGGDRGGLKMGIKGRKFAAVENDAEEDGRDEGKVLKPCLYKIR